MIAGEGYNNAMVNSESSSKSVVVIGGGETGNDCVQTAINQGTLHMHQLEIVSQARVKADPMHEVFCDA